MLTPTQLELLASCIEIGLEGAEAPCTDIHMIEAVVVMIRELMPTIEDNGGATLPLLGPNEVMMIDWGLKALAGEKVEVPAANLPIIHEFGQQWSRDHLGFDQAPTTH